VYLGLTSACVRNAGKTIICRKINGQVRRKKYATEILSNKTKIFPGLMYRFKTKDGLKHSKWRFLDWQYEC
jgi:hypothetical protein